MLTTLIAALVVLAVPAVLVLGGLALVGSVVATLADGRFSIVRPPTH